jgi:pyruvate/2-oxoglutarate dehydrogenase complex dihydrolipoamide acyltransferase (E2) component
VASNSVKTTIVLPAQSIQSTGQAVFTVASWHKNLGEAVYAGDVLVTLAPDNRAITATQFGVLVKKCVLVGEAIEPGEPLAILTTPPAPVPSQTPSVAPYTPQGSEAIYSPHPLARHHTYALTQVPTILTKAEFDASEIIRLASKTENQTLPFILAAVAAQLRLHTSFNAQWLSEKEIRRKEHVHIALEKQTIAHADTKSVAHLAREITTPQPTNFSATFTLTQITSACVIYQTPVLHLPQVAHLVCVSNRLIFAHDARVATESEAVAFLEAVVAHLQNAAFLFV